jgi:hypothetical protein
MMHDPIADDICAAAYRRCKRAHRGRAPVADGALKRMRTIWTEIWTGQNIGIRRWVVKNRLGMIVYGPQMDGSYRDVWVGDMGIGFGSVAWLPVTMAGDGKTQIVQLLDFRNIVFNSQLSMIVYGPQAGGSYKEVWGNGDMGEGSGAVA